jgi:SAM-dependent methyltransferase
MSVNYLDYSQRLPQLLELITKAFQAIHNMIESGWPRYNGASSYGLCGVDDYELVKKIIKVQNELFGQKEFFLLDIGCGNFQWSHGIADYINKQVDLPKDIKVHILGIRGENYLGPRVVEADRCKIYNLGAFKVENLFEEFKKQFEIDLENKLDLVISRYCFCHLADPTGTVLQVLRLLRPGGFFLLDGFRVLYEKDDLLSVDWDKNITQLFLDTKLPFLTHYGINRTINHFLLQKPKDYVCRLPMKYHSIYDVNDSNYSIRTEFITRFMRTPSEEDNLGFQFPNRSYNDQSFYEWFGNEKLYNWLKENDLLYQKKTQLKPLRG